MKKYTQAVPSLVVLAAVVGLWWAAVALTKSVIFPTPWHVVTGTLELARDGTLWEHIGASLFRVGAGFGIAVLFAIPLGLWMGWVRGAFVTLNPVFQILRPISPIAWIPLAILWFGVGNASPIFLISTARKIGSKTGGHGNCGARPASGGRGLFLLGSKSPRPITSSRATTTIWPRPDAWLRPWS